jgi:hypothetical protein
MIPRDHDGSLVGPDETSQPAAACQNATLRLTEVSYGDDPAAEAVSAAEGLRIDSEQLTYLLFLKMVDGRILTILLGDSRTQSEASACERSNQSCYASESDKFRRRPAPN